MVASREAYNEALSKLNVKVFELEEKLSNPIQKGCDWTGEALEQAREEGRAEGYKDGYVTGRKFIAESTVDILKETIERVEGFTDND